VFSWPAGLWLLTSCTSDSTCHSVGESYCSPTLLQGEQYDEAAELVRMWVPELAALPPAARHRPWNLTGDEALAAGYVHGVTYPEAVVDVSSQIGVGPSPSPGGKGGKGRQRKQAAAMAAQQRSSA